MMSTKICYLIVGPVTRFFLPHNLKQFGVHCLPEAVYRKYYSPPLSWVCTCIIFLLLGAVNHLQAHCISLNFSLWGEVEMGVGLGWKLTASWRGPCAVEMVAQLWRPHNSGALGFVEMSWIISESVWVCMGGSEKLGMSLPICLLNSEI